MINYSKMTAPSEYRPTWRRGVIQIHITRACDLSCTGCTQGSNLAGKPVIMSPALFRTAVESLKDYYGVVGIFGGNPTVHPKFEEISRILAEVIPFEQRGLWSNNLNGYGKLCREIYNPDYSNLNVHCDSDKYDEMKNDWPESMPKGLTDSRHSPPYVAMKDILDIDDSTRYRLIENCDINKYWSAMICQFRGELRGYFCELAGAQSMLHQHESDYPDTGLLINPDWWKHPIETYSKQIDKHCMECGIPLKGMGDLAVGGTTEYVSATHEKIYKLKRPTGKTIKLVSKLSDLDGQVNRATDYIENGSITGDLMDTKVLIAVPTSEMARRADFYDYYNALQKPPNTLQCASHGQSPARNRNIMIRQALEHNCTHILFLDDDMAFEPDLLMKLLAHDKDIVTGLYLMRNYPHFPVIFDEAYADGRCKFSFLNDGRTGLVEIVNCGLGACLIKTDVFRNMPDPWITLGELEKDHWCDDIAFFLRAQKAGYKLYCDLNTPVGHMVSGIIWPKMVDNKWYTTMMTTASSEGVQFPQSTPSVEEIEKNLVGLGLR